LQIAKGRQMTVGDRNLNERFRESISAKPRIRPRARDGTHIGEQIRWPPLKQSHKFGNRTH